MRKLIKIMSKITKQIVINIKQYITISYKQIRKKNYIKFQFRLNFDYYEIQNIEYKKNFNKILDISRAEQQQIYNIAQINLMPPCLVFVKYGNGEILGLPFFNQYCIIASIKEKVSLILNIPITLVNLMLGFQKLYDQRTLLSYGIQGATVFELVTEYQFYSFDKCKLKPLSSGPRYLSVTLGINFNAKCKEPKCQAYNKYVWVQKGMGNFNILEEVNNCRCPICNNLTQQAFNISYNTCKLTFKGQKYEYPTPIQWHELVQKNTFKYLFHQYFVKNDWEQLQITAEQLDETSTG